MTKFTGIYNSAENRSDIWNNAVNEVCLSCQQQYADGISSLIQSKPNCKNYANQIDFAFKSLQCSKSGSSLKSCLYETRERSQNFIKFSMLFEKFNSSGADYIPSASECTSIDCCSINFVKYVKMDDSASTSYKAYYEKIATISERCNVPPCQSLLSSSGIHYSFEFISLILFSMILHNFFLE
jgi:hypothetical protein